MSRTIYLRLSNKNSNYQKLQILTNSARLMLVFFFPFPAKAYGQHGLLSAIVAAWQEGCTGMSSDPGRDFQPCFVKTPGQSWKNG